MTNLRQVAQQALEAWDDPMGMKDLCVAMDALRKVLAQPEHQAEPLTKERILVLVDAYVEASAKCDHILGHYAQTEFQIAQAKADLAKARATFETAIVAAQPEQEPVAFAAEIVEDVNGVLSTRWADWWMPNEGDKLYTTTPAAQPEPMRLYVEDFARRCGWEKDSGEGAFEYVQRKSYAQGLEDATPPVAQPKQEPVAWIAEVELSVFARTPKEKTTVEIWKKPVLDSDVAIYTAPPQRPTFYQPAANEAVEILKSLGYVYEPTYTGLAWVAKKAAQPEQEPVAWLKEDWTGGHLNYESVYEKAFAAFPVFKHPPAAPEQEPCVGKDPRCPCQDGDACHYKDCGNTKARPVPQAEPTTWREMVVVTLVREGINKHRARELADHFAAQRPWQGLTDEEVNAVYEQAEVLVHDSWVGSGTVGLMFPITLYKMFEAKLKEKNK